MARQVSIAGIDAPDGAEDDVVRRAQGGDSRAAGEIFVLYRDTVFSAVRHLTPAQELEDVCHDAFLEVFRSLPSFRFRCRFSTWVFRVAARVAYRRLRGRKPEEPGGELPEQPAADNPEGDAGRRAALSQVQSVLATMSIKRRAVFVLHEIEGVSLEEIARALGIPRVTARTRLFYARREFFERARANPALRGYLQRE